MKLPTQRKFDKRLRNLALRYNSCRESTLTLPELQAEFYRGYYHGIDVATRELLRLFKVDREEWDKLLDE